MRPRHLIKNVHVYYNNGHVGFTITTKNGLSSFPLSNKRACDYSLRKISQQLPHIKEELEALLLGGADNENLGRLMVGRYIYGYSIKDDYEGMISKQII